MKATIREGLPADFGKAAPFAACAGVSTVRASLTSAALCIAILAWAIANAYLSQL